MIEPAAVGEIIELYKKHGWTLRRALLSDASRDSIAPMLGMIETEASDMDALWFSRKARSDGETWELRRLSALPLALIAILPNDASDDEIEATLEQVADDMRSKTIA